MSGSLTAPDLRKALGDLDRRLGILERRITPPPAAGKGTGGGPFIVVAASDTARERQDLAHYVCDGTADEAEINAACAQANTMWGATVLLLGGRYHLASRIVTGYVHNLLGEGVDATQIYFDYNGDAAAYSGSWWQEFAIHSNTSGLLADFYLNQSNNSGTGYRGGIEQASSWGAMERVWIDLDSDFATQPIQNAAVRFTGGYNAVRHCRIECWEGVAIDGGADQSGNRVENNYIGCATGIMGNGGGVLWVTANDFQGNNGSASTSPYGNHVGGDYEFALGCAIAYYANPFEPSFVRGNRVADFSRHGIVIADAQDIYVAENRVSGCSALASDTYSGIWIADGAFYNTVINNRVTGSGSHHYGIEIADPAGLPAGFNNACEDNFVTMNDLWEGGVTGNFFDGGTNTVTTAGNRV